MATLISLRDLVPHDILVLRDLVRFGALADDQVARRYGNAAFAVDRIARLVDGGLVEQWAPLIQATTLYSATAVGTGVSRCGLRPTRPSLEHLRHDIAVVDLADYLLAQHPDADWRTEREVGRVLRDGPRLMRSRGLRTGPGHRPDGLLLLDGKRLAIELEHTDKGDTRYAHICRWFALNLRVDGVRWYVDDPKIIARLKRANEQHGFGPDIDTRIESFPPGVFVRSWVRP
jgi:hypothetical protein